MVLEQQQQLAVGLRSGHVVFWSLKTNSVVADRQVGSGWPIGMALLGHPDRLAVIEDNGRIAVFDIGSMQLLHSMTAGPGRLTAFAYDKTSQLIAIGGEAREVMIIAMAKSPPTILARLTEHQGTIRSLLFDNSNRRLFSSGDDATIRLWPLQALELPGKDWLQAAEREHGMRLEAGRIVRQPIGQ